MMEIDIPTPGPNEVLIKCMAAPINPSDLAFLNGSYSKQKIYKVDYPIVGGSEGAGLVIGSGGGIMASRILGKRVAFVRKTVGNEMKLGGTY